MILLTLSSGQEVLVREIKMYSEVDVCAVFTLRAQAQKELGSYSSGIGVIGAPSWVLGGALAIGAVEAVMSGIKERKGIDSLNEAAARYHVLLGRGRWFAAEAIKGLGLPEPSQWCGEEAQMKTLELAALGWGKKRDVQTKYRLSDADMATDRILINEPLKYILLDAEFIGCRDADGELQVRWSAVNSMRIVTGSPDR